MKKIPVIASDRRERSNLMRLLRRSAPRNDKIGIVVSEFNRHITQRLLNQCRLELNRRGLPEKNIRVVWVPGAYELPFMAQRLAKTKRFQVIICLGCVIKGQTDHNTHIARWVSVGIGQASLHSNVPIFFGVLTPKNEAQALARSKPGPLNRGREMAEAALKMIQTLKKERV